MSNGKNVGKFKYFTLILFVGDFWCTEAFLAKFRPASDWQGYATPVICEFEHLGLDSKNSTTTIFP